MMMTMMMLLLMLLMMLLLKVLTMTVPTLTESTRRSIQPVCSCLNFPVHALYRFP